MEHEKFQDIFNRNYRKLMYLGLKFIEQREVVQELVNDCFMSILDKEFKSNDDYSHFLYHVLKNKCIDYKRMMNRRRHIVSLDRYYRPTSTELDGLWPEEIIAIKFEDYKIETEMVAYLYAAIKKLSPSDQRLVQLIFFEKKKSVEVAKELSMLPETIRSKKRHLLNRLKLIMKNALLLFI